MAGQGCGAADGAVAREGVAAARGGGPPPGAEGGGPGAAARWPGAGWAGPGLSGQVHSRERDQNCQTCVFLWIFIISGGALFRKQQGLSRVSRQTEEMQFIIKPSLTLIARKTKIIRPG